MREDEKFTENSDHVCYESYDAFMHAHFYLFFFLCPFYHLIFKKSCPTYLQPFCVYVHRLQKLTTSPPVLHLLLFTRRRFMKTAHAAYKSVNFVKNYIARQTQTKKDVNHKS